MLNSKDKTKSEAGCVLDYSAVYGYSQIAGLLRCDGKEMTHAT